MRIFLVILMAYTISLAQSPPCITFNSTHHDFGKIYNSQVSHSFKVTNTGNEYLNITKLNPSCGCTAAVIGKWSLAPNESTNVAVTLNTTGLCSTLKRSVQVTSNDPINPVITLILKANSVQEIMPSTNSVFFDNLLRTSTKKTAIKLISGNGHPVHIQAIATNGNPYITWTTQKEGNNAVINITIDGRKIRRDQSRGVSTIWIRTNNKKVPFVNIAVQWDIMETIISDPPQIGLTGPSGVDLYKSIKLRQINNKPFSILASRSTNTNFKVNSFNKTPMVEHEVQIKVTSKVYSGLHNETIILTVNDPDQPEVVLPIYANLK